MTSIDPAISAAIAVKQQAVQNSVSMAVAGKVLDAMEAQGEAINQLLEGAARVSKAAGKGQRFDAQG